ncbi:MAG: P1 family peptidase [Acidimicrobiales bacterium]|nr:P1 family peptidase [Acidimicrobiales bacterium]
MDVRIPGVTVGHWTDADAQTGCTVVRLPEGTVASGEVRGGAPATREFALLDPRWLVDRVDAIVLSGGSAFGLAAADGVMQALAAEGVGFPTEGGVVPIVVGMCLYDLMVGDGSVRPDAAAGAAALAAATDDPEVGLVGAGTGATVAKWLGVEHRRPGGLGMATTNHGDVVVTAIIAVNAFGDANQTGQAAVLADPSDFEWPVKELPFGNTTIGAVVTNATCTKAECLLLAQAGHDGLARSLRPAHTRHDGDALVAAGVGVLEADLDELLMLAAAAVELATTSIVAPGTP